ncbi:hypothetical protein AB834_04480 [PVC group bacterium (ex Bugula neritina AB1)]|nr:hypothetical protein AB834_04480 [PVC group bacterium (ex Bugula neritina AB1)]
MRRFSFCIFLHLLLTLFSFSCLPNRYIKTFDIDGDGVFDKVLHVAYHRVVKEELDRNRDGLSDTFLFYDEKGCVYMKEHDRDGDGVVDLREEFFPDFSIRRMEDQSRDGQMDRSWTVYYTSEGKPLRMNIDHDFDHVFDTRVNLVTEIREERVSGKWCKSKKKGDQRFIFVKDKVFPVEFVESEWQIIA